MEMLLVSLPDKGLGEYISCHFISADMLNWNKSLGKGITDMVINSIYMVSALMKPIVFNK